MAEMDPVRAQAIEALRVANMLLERYLKDAAGLEAPGVTREMEGRMRALDDNCLGVWTKLDQAAGSLAAAGKDVSYYRGLRQQVDVAGLGFDRQDKVSVTMGGVKQKTIVTISQQRIALLKEALSALHMLLDGVDLSVDADAEVDAFISGQKGPMRLLKTLGVVGGIVGAVALVLLVLHWLRPPDYGELSKTIYALEAEHELDPCNKALAVKLAENLNRAGAYQTALERAAAFFGECGQNRKLRWATLNAHKKLGNHDGAIAEVSKLILAVPRDRDYRFWRGEVRELKGDMEGAIVDYRQCLALSPFLSGVAVGLAGLLREQGRPCEGMVWLVNELNHHPGRSRLEAERLTSLVKNPKCAGWLGQGEAVIKVGRAVEEEGEEQPPVERARLKIGQAAANTYTVAPDLPYTLLSGKLAGQAGLKPAAGEALIVGTPDGFSEGRLHRVARVTLGRATAAKVAVVVVQTPPGGADAVLGQSLLGRFSRVTDPETGAVELLGADVLAARAKAVLEEEEEED